MRVWTDRPHPTHEAVRRAKMDEIENWRAQRRAEGLPHSYRDYLVQCGGLGAQLAETIPAPQIAPSLAAQHARLTARADELLALLEISTGAEQADTQRRLGQTQALLAWLVTHPQGTREEYEGEVERIRGVGQE